MGKGVLGSWFKVSSEGKGIHEMLPPWVFEPSISCMPGKRLSHSATPHPLLFGVSDLTEKGFKGQHMHCYPLEVLNPRLQLQDE